MDIGKAVSYTFDDDQWPSKAGLGALIACVPILNFAAVGYEMQVARNVRQNHPRPLPDWNDLGRLFQDGLMLGLARIVYSLPIFALFGCMGFLFVPWMLSLGVTQTDNQTNAVMLIFMLVCGLVWAAITLYSLAFGLISPAITVQYIRQGTFGACFNVGAILRFVRDNFSDYLMFWLGLVLAQIVLSAVVGSVGGCVSLIPFVGTFIYLALLAGMVIYIQLFSGHLVGQILRADDARTAVNTPPNLQAG